MIGNFSKLKNWLSENLLLILTFSGVVIGVVGGLALRYWDPADSTIHLLAYPGELFMRLLKLMILPLIIASLITGESKKMFHSKLCTLAKGRPKNREGRRD